MQNQSIPTIIFSRYKNLTTLEPKKLGIRKKIALFVSTNEDDVTTLILHITQKSRFLQKDVDKMEEIIETIMSYLSLNHTKKVILIDSPLCSKANSKLELQEWAVLS